MEETAKLIIDGKTSMIPLVTGTEGERAIDISTLRQRTGLITLDPATQHGSCESSDHFHGRERGNPALPRHTGRAARREVLLSRDRLTCSSMRGTPRRAELNRFLGDAERPFPRSRGHAELLHQFPEKGAPHGHSLFHGQCPQGFLSRDSREVDQEAINITFSRLLSKVRPWRPCPTRSRRAIRSSIPATG